MAKKDMSQCICQQYGISTLEYHVLCSVNYRIGGNPNEVARHTFLLNDSHIPKLSYERYEKAISSCIKKGWLIILSNELCRLEEVRRKSSSIPELEDLGLSPGAVDFTTEGFHWFRDLQISILGIEHVYENDSGWNLDENGLFIDAYAQTEKLCLNILDNIKLNIEDYTGEPASIKNINGPFVVGHWKPNRFHTVPVGYTAKVQYCKI